VRYAVPLLAVLSLGFAPLPFPKPAKDAWTTVHLKYVVADAVAPEVQKLLGPRGKLQVDLRSNALLVKDRPDVVNRVVDFIRLMDSLDKPLRFQ
jgi:type II secretory pathway component GspD/PulD (secretin)